MQEAPRVVVIPRIVCTRPSVCEDDDNNNCNSDVNLKTTRNNNNCNVSRQRKIARSRVRRNSRRLQACRGSSSSSSRSPSPNHRNTNNNLRRNSHAITTGYKQYLELLQVPTCANGHSLEFAEASDNDLSSEWSDSDQSCTRNDDDHANGCDGGDAVRNDVVKVYYTYTYI